MGWLEIILEILTPIGAIAGLIAAVIRLHAEIPLTRSVSSRVDALDGRWDGSILQPDHPAGIVTSSFSMTLKRRGRHLTGSIHLVAVLPARGDRPATDIAIDLIARGGFVRESVIRIEYANRDRSVLQFGTIYFELAPTANEMTGRLAGYGQYAGSVIHGEVVCIRVS